MTVAVGIRLVILVVILTWPTFFSWLSELEDGPGRIGFMLHQAYYLPFSWVGAPLFEPDSEVGFEVQPTGRAFAAFFYVLWFYVIIRIIDRAKLASVYRERRSDATRKPRGSMSTQTYLAAPVPELPVVDVERAQQHYRDVLGFTVNWTYPDKTISGISRGDISIFIRQRTPPFEPAVHWMFAPDIDATYQELKSAGANIVEPLEKKPWGLLQFTIEDVDGNRFHIHHD